MSIKVREKRIGTSAEIGAGAGFQFATGAGVVLGMSVDYSASADAGTVLTLRDGFSTSDDLMYTITGNTDIGTTVPIRLFQNGRLISGTSTDNVHAGLPFFDGLFINAASDVAGPQDVIVYYKPLHRKNGSITTAGAAGSATGSVVLWQGQGLLHAFRCVFDPSLPTTTDLTIYDGISTSGRAYTAIANSVTNSVASANEALSTTTGHDEAGTALTTAANAHENDGILFRTGITVGLAQANAVDRAASVTILVES